jgi:hypothetical protein
VQPRQLSYGEVIWEQWLAKFDPLGNQIWRSVLPGHNNYWIPLISRAKTVVFAPDGSVVVVGGVSRQTPAVEFPRPNAFAARYSSHGELLWWTDHLPNGVTNSVYFNVLVNRYGMVGAAGTGVAMFTKQGRLAYFESDGSGVVGETARGSFLLDYRGLPAELNPSGRKFKWTFANPVASPWELQVVDRDRYVVMARPMERGSGLAFIGIDGDGGEEWRQEFPSHNLKLELFDSPRFFLLANAKTFRVVGYFPGPLPGTTSGISVGAFEFTDLR